jgi:hypothetical protein
MVVLTNLRYEARAPDRCRKRKSPPVKSPKATSFLPTSHYLLILLTSWTFFQQLDLNLENIKSIILLPLLLNGYL